MASDYTLSKGDKLTVCSFNMHGFSSGVPMLRELSLHHAIIGIQETWLDESNMHKLGLVNDDFSFCGVSSMTDRIAAGNLVGRPFGGVAFLWHNSIANRINVIKCDNDGRCIALTVKADSKLILFICIYMPCADDSVEYRNLVSKYCGCMEDVILSSHCTDVVIFGDFNFSCDVKHRGYRIFDDFSTEYKLMCCDKLSGGVNTYSSAAFNQESCIDHFFVSPNLYATIFGVEVINHSVNFSDHKPVSCSFNIAVNNPLKLDRPVNRETLHRQYKARWDKANLADYYAVSLQHLDLIDVDNCIFKCSPGCNSNYHRALVDKLYQDIVYALQQTETLTIPRIPYKGLKPFWNDYLDELKERSVFWGRLWTDAGRPRYGELFRLKSTSAYNYKAAIRQAIIDYDNSLDNDLYAHFIHKESEQFWKCWNKKFNRKALSDKPQQVNGLNDSGEIAQAFADSFKNVHYNSYSDVETLNQYSKLCNDSDCLDDECNEDVLIDSVNVELVDKTIRSLKLGKASGPDALSAEHLIHAHPKLTIMLAQLFRSMLLHEFVPTNFGKGVVIPLVKDKNGDLSNVNNYRGITLTSVISKLFERVILHLCEDHLKTEDVQLGFKKSLGCPNAIFVVRSTIDYFIERRSTVYVAALDIRKAYDTVHHVKLFVSLLEAGLPHWFVRTLANWYSKLFVAVRWLDSLSSPFQVCSGCSQGSCLSPALFNLFINRLIKELKDLGIGCSINRTWVGCVMYADDAILLSTSVRGLQIMLDHCGLVSYLLKLDFNCSKCTCAAFGPKHASSLALLYLNNQPIQWAPHMKYLGVSFLTGQRLTCNIDVISRKFYTASHCISNNSRFLDELLQLQLQQTYCLPILQYGMSAMRLNANQLNTLNVCWNNVYRKIFHFFNWESVSAFIAGLGFLNFTHLWFLSVYKLIKSMLRSCNTVVCSITRLFCKSAECAEFAACCNVNISCPLYIIEQSLRERFINLSN